MHDKDKNYRYDDTSTEQDILELSNDPFSSVMVLYAHYLQMKPLIKGGMYYHAGEAEATPTDFCCDVVIKARRALTLYEYTLWTRLGIEMNTAELLPDEVKTKLRLAWVNLVYEYRRLFIPIQRAWDVELKKIRRREVEKAKRALDDGAYALYAEERAAVELLETQEENSNDEAA